MKFRTTFILLLVAIGLGVYLKFVEPKLQSTQENQEHGREFVKVDRDKVNAISIKSAEAKVQLKKKDNVWFIEEPLKDRADSMAISQLFTTLELLKYDSAIGADGKAPDKEQIKDYGLANSETKIKIAGADKTVELQFGKDTAVEGKVYVKLEGSNVVYVIGNDLKNQISKKADEFRDKKLTDLAVGNVRKAVIKTAGEELELEKKNEHWSLVKPLKARGDDSKINDLISQAITARIDTFVADSANLSAYGLEQPRGTVSLTVEGSDQPTVLQIGTNPKDDKEKTYAKLSTRDAVVLLPDIDRDTAGQEAERFARQESRALRERYRRSHHHRTRGQGKDGARARQGELGSRGDEGSADQWCHRDPSARRFENLAGDQLHRRCGDGTAEIRTR